MQTGDRYLTEILKAESRNNGEEDKQGRRPEETPAAVPVFKKGFTPNVVNTIVNLDPETVNAIKPTLDGDLKRKVKKITINTAKNGGGAEISLKWGADLKITPYSLKLFKRMIIESRSQGDLVALDVAQYHKEQGKGEEDLSNEESQMREAGAVFFDMYFTTSETVRGHRRKGSEDWQRLISRRKIENGTLSWRFATDFYNDYLKALGYSGYFDMRLFGIDGRNDAAWKVGAFLSDQASENGYYIPGRELPALVKDLLARMKLPDYESTRAGKHSVAGRIIQPFLSNMAAVEAASGIKWRIVDADKNELPKDAQKLAKMWNRFYTGRVMITWQGVPEEIVKIMQDLEEKRELAQERLETARAIEQAKEDVKTRKKK